MTLRTLAVLALVAVCGAGTLRGQTPGAATPDFAGEAAVIEHTKISLVFAPDGSHTEESEVRVRIQSTGALQELGTVAVPYSREFDTLEFLYVRVQKPDGTIVETPVSGALEVPADVTREAPTYSDIYLKHVNVQGLAVGDTLSYAVRTNERSPLPGTFWFEHTWSKDMIILSADVTASLPADMKATVKSIDPQPVVRVENGRRLYAWHYTNLSRPDEKTRFGQG